jgi:hypothetical protein
MLKIFKLVGTGFLFLAGILFLGKLAIQTYPKATFGTFFVLATAGAYAKAVHHIF